MFPGGCGLLTLEHFEKIKVAARHQTIFIIQMYLPIGAKVRVPML